MTLLGSEHSILIRSKFRSVLQLRLQQRRTREQLADQSIMSVAGQFYSSKVNMSVDLVNHSKFPKQEDSYAFEEDSGSESLSPEQNHSDESQGSACPSSEAVGSTASSSPALTSRPQGGASRDSSNQSQEESASKSQTTPPIPVPAIVKSKTSDKNRHKKPKDVKPKVKKLKYHQYIPPDQKAEKSPPPMDSAYARLLQQQQLFLQLQILQKHAHSQQRQAAFSYQPQTQPHKAISEQMAAGSSSGPSSSANSNSSSPVKNIFPNQISSSSPSVRPGPLPANLDDLKVSELRQHLRIRGMPVSGTKTALIERLRPFRDSSPTGSSDIATLTFPVTPTGSLSSCSTVSQGGYYPYPSTSSSPPISPASSDLSLSGSLPDSFSDVPMSSPTHFTLQPSPAQLAMEDGAKPAGQKSGESGGGDGLDAEKDKMLVEKQKVIEELTWKLHREQRQVEELKMQLHKRKRSYGATHDSPIPSQPGVIGQHFFGVTVKQEPVALSSSCPLSSPKQLKNASSCMEDMPHCSNAGGPQCMDTCPSSGSPHNMSAYLGPHSPQNSPNGKVSTSSQPSSPNNPYLLCGRHKMQPMQTRSSSQQVTCSYPADQRNHQHAFPPDCSLNHNGCTKTENPTTQAKMSVSPRHVKCQAFSSSDSDASDLGHPPCYEDAVKQQLTRSQQMDELLDVLIESGEMPANAREERERSSVTKVVPHIPVSPGCPGLLIPRFHRHYDHPSSNHLLYDHSNGHISEHHLQTLLNNPVGRAGEAGHLEMAAIKRGQEDEVNSEEFGNSQDRHCNSHQDKLLTNRDLLDTPLSPICSKGVPEVQGMVSMTFSETPWETMEWLDLTPSNSGTAFSIAQSAMPSIFNTEFLDVTGINLNSAMDLHLEHW